MSGTCKRIFISLKLAWFLFLISGPNTNTTAINNPYLAFTIWRNYGKNDRPEFNTNGRVSSYQYEYPGGNFNPSRNCGVQQIKCNPLKDQFCNPYSRIIGGSASYKGEFPWMVLLVTTHNNRKQFCAGTLLDRWHILTANHCVFDFGIVELARLRAILGEHDIRTTMDGMHEERRVREIFKHPKWNQTTNENDIAILKLRRPVDFTNYIQPICLPSILTDDLAELHEDGRVLGTIVGWGRTKANHSQKSAVPVKAVLPLFDRDRCRKLYFPFSITENMICAGGNGKDACLGDSGGGYFLKNHYSGRWEQVGVISWGNSCYDLPGVYTNVENYLDWIKKTIVNSNNRNVNLG